jgi:hypothetical protein
LERALVYTKCPDAGGREVVGALLRAIREAFMGFFFQSVGFLQELNLFLIHVSNVLMVCRDRLAAFVGLSCSLV